MSWFINSPVYENSASFGTDRQGSSISGHRVVRACFMPNRAHKRLDRIVNHLSASSPSTKPAGPMSEQTARPPITAHALDTAIGKPARGLPLKLEQRSGGSRGGRFWLLLGSCETNEDGRAPNLLASGYVSVFVSHNTAGSSHRQ